MANSIRRDVPEPSVEGGEWVVLELSPRSEGEDPDVVRQAIQHSIRGAEVFIPAFVTQIGEQRRVHYLVDGYAFVRKVLPDTAYARLENTRYVQSALTASGVGRNRKLATVREADIENFRRQIRSEVDQGIAVGDKVRITTGAYRNIDATVIEDIPEQQAVQVFVQLRSKQSLVTIPRSGLCVVERAPTSPVYSRLTGLRTWIRTAAPVLTWTAPGLTAVLDKFAQLRTLCVLEERHRRVFSFVTSYSGALERRVGEARTHAAKLSRFDTWLKKCGSLYTFISLYYQSHERSLEGRLGEVQSKLAELSRLDSLLRRIRTLGQEVEALDQQSREDIKEGSRPRVQNIVVDGHNLAFRCLTAPHVSGLSDSKGRPTGVVYGVLRGIAALKKRYPSARIYVAWDGSSKRRKQRFAEYKANRPSHSAGSPEGFDQLQFLRRVLPHLGVWQVTNSEEEADDIMATLVRGPLAKEQNLIFTTDRDMLQLVTANTQVLSPAVGNRNEMLFDSKAVEASYGVSPQRIIQLRAFCGDSSDNIPGVPRVPKKVLRSLVQAHSTVEGVYGSGLVGLTKAQYERIRSSEPQVRINLELMGLLDIPISVQEPDVDPEVVAAMLREVEVNPDSILGTFFGHRSE